MSTLVLMGSGETTPTMVTIHQRILRDTAARRGGAVDAILLDTPYGFQENRDEITAKAQHYFNHNVGTDVTLVPAERLDDEADPLATQRALAAVRAADWIFAGPGSPTYALRQWTAAGMQTALAEAHASGATVVMASAAAVTAGSHALRVYETYKAGEPARWADGMDLVRRVTGWPAVVIPHYDNAEGGTHDTRFCYMGERRLQELEAELDDQTWILGIDEHTACIIESGPGTDGEVVRVEGRGSVHVRRGGIELLSVPSGSTTTAAEILAAIAAGTGLDGETAAPADGAAEASVVTADASADNAVRATGDPLADALAETQAAFDRGLVDGDADVATGAALRTEQLIRDWSSDSLDSDGLDAAVAQLRGMITRLGNLAAEGLHDHRQLVAPHIETLLHVREDARAEKLFAVADHIRDHMDADGVRIKDTREGTNWEWDDPTVP